QAAPGRADARHQDAPPRRSRVVDGPPAVRRRRTATTRPRGAPLDAVAAVGADQSARGAGDGRGDGGGRGRRGHLREPVVLGGVLTRAYRRVAGTAGGIVVGVGAVLLSGQHTSVLVGISVVAVFGMLYLGPVRYVYTPFFMTVVVVAVYAILGDLRHGVLERRLEETVAGAVIGVLCAYAILSASSHPDLVGRVRACFRALDALLQVGDRTFGGRGDGHEALAALHELEAARDDVEATVEAMSAALLGRHESALEAVRLLDVVTRACGVLAQAVMRRGAHGDGSPADGDRVVQDAIAAVRRAADDAR